MSLPKGARRSIVLSLCLILLVGVGPSSSAVGPSPGTVAATWGLEGSPGLHWFRSLARDQGLGPRLEQLIGLFLDDAPKVKTGEFAYTVFTRDISGDGLRDELVLFTEYRIEGADVRSKTTVTAVEGHTGRELWHRRAPGRDTIVLPVNANVGAHAGGLILVEVEGFRSDTTEMIYRFRALNDGGKQVWKHVVRTSIVGNWPVTFTADNYLVTGDIFNALKGPTSELLLASGPVVYPPVWSLQSGVITASTVDGRDGNQSPHPVPEVGAGFVPFAEAVGDLDGDRLDDYVFLNKRPEAILGGEGEPPASVHDGVVNARRGSDGTPGWSSKGLDFTEQNVSVTDLGDMTKDGIGDVFVETNPYSGRAYATYLVEGSEGDLWWKRPGQWPYSPGDIDGNRRRDVLTQSYYSGKGFTATKVWAHDIGGRRLWKKEYRTEHPLYRCCSSLFHFGGSWSVGDVDGRGLLDGGIYHFPPFVTDGVKIDGENIVIDARRGSILARGGEDLYPLGVAIDADGADIAYIEWAAPGDLAIRVMDGATDRVLLESRVGFDIPIDQKAYIELEAARLDRDRCADLALTVESKVPTSERRNTAESSAESLSTYEVVIDGAGGSLLWAKSIGSRDGSVKLISRTDSNSAC